MCLALTARYDKQGFIHPHNQFHIVADSLSVALAGLLHSVLKPPNIKDIPTIRPDDYSEDGSAATGTLTVTVLHAPPSPVSLPHAAAPATSRHGRTTCRPYQQRLLQVHSPLPTPPLASRVFLPHAAAPAAGRDGMTPSACHGQGDRCRYRHMAARRRPSAARRCLAARGRPWGKCCLLADAGW